jgi:hypothetical protein
MTKAEDDEVERLRRMAEQPSEDLRNEEREIALRRQAEIDEQRWRALLKAWEEVEREYPYSAARKTKAAEIYRRSLLLRPDDPDPVDR